MQYRQFPQRDSQLSRNQSNRLLPEIRRSNPMDGSNTVRGSCDIKDELPRRKVAHTVRFEDMEPPKLKNESILKRKSSNSRDHTDIDTFFEQAEKQVVFQRKHNKHVSLQPLNLEKKVSFNNEIEVKLIEDIDKKYSRPTRRHFTLNDLK